MAKDETLRDVITRLVNDGEADPAVIAEQARVLAPRNLIEDALQGMLYELAREVLRQRRSLLLSGGTPRGGHPSRKHASMLEYAAAWLAGSLNIGPNQWKLLAECTADDLTAAADYSDQLAQANATRAKHYRRMVDALVRYNAATLNDLPVDVLNELGTRDY